MLTSNWNEWKRMQINIDKAQCNEEVTVLLNQHYPYLHTRLVKLATDEDIFNDTFLKLTYLYNPEEDFINQYCYYFKLLKGAYYRDAKVTKWLEVPLSPIEAPDTSDVPEPEEIDKEQFINTLRNAITKESTKIKKQNLQKGRKIEGVPVR